MGLLHIPSFNGNSKQRRIARRKWLRENEEALARQEEEINEAIRWIKENKDSRIFDRERTSVLGKYLEMTEPKETFFGEPPMTPSALERWLAREGIVVDKSIPKNQEDGRRTEEAA